jgi:hypothetical protein
VIYAVTTITRPWLKLETKHDQSKNKEIPPKAEKEKNE